jgi:hypothetical protein
MIITMIHSFFLQTETEDDALEFVFIKAYLNIKFSQIFT